MLYIDHACFPTISVLVLITHKIAAIPHSLIIRKTSRFLPLRKQLTSNIPKFTGALLDFFGKNERDPSALAFSFVNFAQRSFMFVYAKILNNLNIGHNISTMDVGHQ